MNNKNAKKLRQIVRRNETKLVDTSWDVFFDVVAKLPRKDRRKIARFIKKGVNPRELEKVKNNGTSNTRN